ncbi:MAG: hypothetical protein KAI72_04080 [Candidatus Pacebacteria bacterium]|nr:hypothetical protein [Candidatus Paceibacterota bacterium]
MLWIIKLLFGKSEYVWLPVRILKETDKAILVPNYRKFWIAKSQIVKMRLRKGVFEVYVGEDLVR